MGTRGSLTCITQAQAHFLLRVRRRPPAGSSATTLCAGNVTTRASSVNRCLAAYDLKRHGGEQMATTQKCVRFSRFWCCRRISSMRRPRGHRSAHDSNSLQHKYSVRGCGVGVCRQCACSRTRRLSAIHLCRCRKSTGLWLSYLLPCSALLGRICNPWPDLSQRGRKLTFSGLRILSSLCT